MDPNDWKRDADGLRADMAAALKDKGVADRVLNQLAALAPQGRQHAWDNIGEPVFKAAIKKRPGRTRSLHAVMKRLRRVFFSGHAAEAPGRIQEVLGQ